MADNKTILKFSREQIATAVAIIFHAIGLVGILFFNKEYFVTTTVINLLLMFVLVLYSQQEISRNLILFIFLVFSGGMIVEIIGTNTGNLFGSYSYGKSLGFTFFNVPLIIGVNWFLMMYCCGISMQKCFDALSKKFSTDIIQPKPFIKNLSVVVDGALLATAFDWLMEPVAIKLGYWKWAGDGSVPLYNYLCWFGISCVFLFVFSRFGFSKTNKFGVNLLLIQAMFFLLLRTFL